MSTPPPLVGRLLAYLNAGDDLERRATQLTRAGVASAILLGVDGLTEAQREALRSAVDATVVATLRAEQTAGWVSRALAEHDIRHVHLKGMLLAEAWEFGWSTSAARTWGDVDMLVLEADVPRALDALSSQGQVIPGPATGSQRVVSTPHRGALDLHWELLNDTPLVARHQLEARHILDNHVVWNGPVGRLTPEMTLVHTVLHALISNLTRPAALFDIDGVARDRHLDWDRLQHLVKARDLELPIGVALAATAHWLRTPVPAGMLPRWSPWSSLCAAAARRDPVEHLDHGWTGAEVFRLTRHSDAASLRALVTAIPLELRVQRRIRKAQR